MDRHVPVTLLKTAVFANVMQVIPPDHNRPLHLHLLDDASENAATDRYVSGEWAFLVNVGSVNRLK